MRYIIIACRYAFHGCRRMVCMVGPIHTVGVISQCCWGNWGAEVVRAIRTFSKKLISYLLVVCGSFLKFSN